MKENNEKVKIFLVWLFPIAMYSIFAVIYKANIIEILINFAIIGSISLFSLRICLFADENVSLGLFTVFLWIESPIIIAAAYILEYLIVPKYYGKSGSGKYSISEGSKYYPIVYSMEIFMIFHLILCIILLFAFEIHAKLKN